MATNGWARNSNLWAISSQMIGRKASETSSRQKYVLKTIRILALYKNFLVVKSTCSWTEGSFEGIFNTFVSGAQSDGIENRYSRLRDTGYKIGYWQEFSSVSPFLILYIFAKRSPSQSKSIPIGLDVDGITFAISPPTPTPPGKVPIVDSKQHPGEYNIRPASDYIWTAP